ncbi:MAG: trypsin-like peptidase domain-containing protein [Gammaproteobacteria bacterium]|nr:trypsin-like peptidase domain-containing protein [Gammaproteobacteria bacterium]MCP5407898.1 trypsin-like peptidase domain-containing protein [Chromatiaceae bacterium]
MCNRSCSILLLSPLLLLFHWTTAAASDLSDLFVRVREAVVVVGAESDYLPGPDGVRPTGGIGSLGSGVLITQEGRVLTAAHLVQAADRVVVRFASGATVGARVVTSAPFADVALLQLDHIPEDAVVAVLADSSKVLTGDEVFVVGAPYGLSHSLTAGHISARYAPGSLSGGFERGTYFQTDAAVNQGNSGGPMFNMDGEVIGVVSHILSKSGGFEGLGFVVTANSARELVLERQAFWLGLEGVMLSEQMAELLNLPQNMGMLVQKVAQDSPAARLGLRPGTLQTRIGTKTLMLGGDIVLAVAGVPMEKERDVYTEIRTRLEEMAPDDTLSLEVLRGGQRVQLSAPRGN